MTAQVEVLNIPDPAVRHHLYVAFVGLVSFTTEIPCDCIAGMRVRTQQNDLA